MLIGSIDTDESGIFCKSKYDRRKRIVFSKYEDHPRTDPSVRTCKYKYYGSTEKIKEIETFFPERQIKYVDLYHEKTGIVSYTKNYVNQKLKSEIYYDLYGNMYKMIMYDRVLDGKKYKKIVQWEIYGARSIDDEHYPININFSEKSDQSPFSYLNDKRVFECYTGGSLPEKTIVQLPEGPLVVGELDEYEGYVFDKKGIYIESHQFYDGKNHKQETGKGNREGSTHLKNFQKCNYDKIIENQKKQETKHRIWSEI